MAGKVARVAGITGATSPRPRCSVGHTTPAVRNPDGTWVCPDCFNEFVARKHDNKTVGGVVLPASAEKPDYFKHVFPNRRARRAAR